MKSAAEQKTEYTVRAKAEMDEYLRSKTWVEKVRSIERMNAADRLAKEAMRKALKKSDSPKGQADAEPGSSAGVPSTDR
jgi:ribonuclease HI